MNTDDQQELDVFAQRIGVALDSSGQVYAALANQLPKSGTSVCVNTEEAQASQSNKDFVHKYSIACKEARETHYWLRLHPQPSYCQQHVSNL